jgi:hypothetical protein
MKSNSQSINSLLNDEIKKKLIKKYRVNYLNLPNSWYELTMYKVLYNKL